MNKLTLSAIAVFCLIGYSSICSAQSVSLLSALSDPLSDAFQAKSPTPAGGMRGAQTIERSSVYIELFGNGLIYSLNFDQLITNHIALRGGIGYIGFGATSSDGSKSVSASILTIPLTASYLFSSDAPLSNHKFEVGAGVTIISLTGASYRSFGASGVIGTAIIGYRYQPVDGGVLFRADVTPFFGQGLFLVSGGISVGYTF